MENFYVIYDPKSLMFVAIDQSSGGYPYLVPLRRANQFETFEKASKYKDMFRSPNNTYKANDWEVKIATIKVT